MQIVTIWTRASAKSRSRSIPRWWTSFASTVTMRTPSDLSRCFASFSRFCIMLNHLLWRQVSFLSTKRLLYFQSRAPVLYGGSM